MADNVIRIRSFGIPTESLRLTTLSGQAVPVRLYASGPNEVEIRPLSPLASGLYLLSGNQGTPQLLTVKVLVR